MQMTFKPEDEQAFQRTADSLVQDFEASTGHAGWLAHQMLNFKWGYLDGRLDHWRRDDLDQALLGLFPRKVMMDPEDIGQVIPTVQAFLRWVHDTHGLHGDPLPRLLAHLSRITPQVEDELDNPANFGMGKMLVSHMSTAGVDLQDPDAVQGFMDAFNAQPMEQRKAMLPLPGDPGVPVAEPELGPLPPLRPVSAAQLVRAAESSPLYRWVRGFADNLGEGRGLTNKGNLRLADGRQLVEVLQTGDVVDPEFGSLRSTEELTHLDLAFRVARAAGFVKIRHSKVQPTRRATELTASIDTDWPRVVDGLLDVGILAHRYRSQYHMVPPWVDQLDDSVASILITLYATNERLPIEMFVDMLRDELAQQWVLEEPRADGWGGVWWDVVESNVRLLLDRLELAGVCEVTDVEEVPRAYVGTEQRGGNVKLTVAGRMVAADVARRAGLAVGEAGRLADLDAAELLGALADAEPHEIDAELEVWIDGRDPLEAADQLVEAFLNRPADMPRPLAANIAFAGITSLEAADAEPFVRRLAEDRMIAPVAAGWLEDHGLDAPRLDPVEGLMAMAALGAGDEAVIGLEGFGPAAEQASLVQHIRREHHAEAIPLFEAVADLHPDKTVTKAARKALFSLGVRRR